MDDYEKLMQRSREDTSDLIDRMRVAYPDNPMVAMHILANVLGSLAANTISEGAPIDLRTALARLGEFELVARLTVIETFRATGLL